MSVKIHTGELKHQVVFKQPTSSLNDEGGREVTYTTSITTWAKVDKFNQYRTTEAMADDLIGSLDFYIRYSADRSAINKDWRIEYKGEDYIIHQIELVEQKEMFLRFTAKGSGDASEVGVTVENFTDFTFDPLTGLMEFTGADSGDIRTAIVISNIPDVGVGYENAEGVGYSVGPFLGTSVNLTYLTPGDVIIKWRKIGGPPSFVPLSEYEQKTITVTRLARRWYRIWKTGPVEIYPGFSPIHLYNVLNVDLGLVSDIDELISTWNSDPDNAAFGQIIGYRTLNGFYEVQVEPNSDQTAYPMQFIKVEV